jgi:hypothetical protein
LLLAFSLIWKLKNVRLYFLKWFVPHISIANHSGIISKNSIQWCKLPLNNYKDKTDGIPLGINDIAHPSIVYIPKKWNGFSHWMAATPYPTSLPASGEPYENTCVFMANSPDEFSHPYSFVPIQSNPILFQGEARYNSDPDLFYDSKSKCLFCITRKRRGPNYVTDIVLQSSSDGQNWSIPVSIIRLQLEEEFLSPCLVSFNDCFRIYAFQVNPSDRAKTISIDIWESSSLQHPNFCLYKKIKWDSSVNIWHGGIFSQNNKLYLLACGSHNKFRYITGGKDISKYLFLGIANDGENFIMFDRPLLQMNGVYRPSGFIDEKGQFVCYVSFHNRNSGDKSYPAGNRIGLLEYPFSQLINELSKDRNTL